MHMHMSSCTDVLDTDLYLYRTTPMTHMDRKKILSLKWALISEHVEKQRTRAAVSVSVAMSPTPIEQPPAHPTATFITETLITSHLDRQRLSAINENVPQHHAHPTTVPVATAAPTQAHHLSAHGLSTASTLVTSLLNTHTTPEHLTEHEIKARVRDMLHATSEHVRDARDGVTEEGTLSAAYWEKLETCVLPMR